MIGLFGPSTATCYALPSRVSDAGPEQGEPMDWRDRCFEAEWEAKAAQKTYRDNAQAEYKLRIEAIERAIDHLHQAKALLVVGAA